MSLAGHRTTLDPHLAVLNFSDTEITFVDGLGKGIGLLWNLTRWYCTWLPTVCLLVSYAILVGYC